MEFKKELNENKEDVAFLSSIEKKIEQIKAFLQEEK